MPAPGTVPKTLSADGHIVGREAETALLEDFLGSTATPRALVLSGGPGVGKTSLCEVVIDAARRQGLRVLRASGSGAAASVWAVPRGSSG
jgi:replication-associated recombination protein RarA